MNNFNKIGSMDVSNTVYKIAALDENVWHEFTFRQDYHEHHIHSQTIPLLYNMHLDEDGKLSQYVNLFEKEMKELNDILLKYYKKGKLVRCMIVNLLPRKEILPHVDSDPSLLKIKRHHLPLVTNSEVVFRCEDEYLNMQTGEIWEFRNDLPHAVYNKSPFRRIHIIADWDIDG